MTEDETIYEVEVKYTAVLQGGQPFPVDVTATTTVRGKDERDKLLKMVRDMGFDVEWRILSAPNANGAMAKISRMFKDWPPQGQQ